MPGPLEGIRVLDLTQGIAGPYATKLCSDYGADVVKIEHPQRGDIARRLGPFPTDEPHSERSGMFLELNTGKQSVTLDLSTASGRGILLRLAAAADVIVESFRPGTLERLGLGPEVLHEANPRAALVRISNFGQTGPYRDFRADDMLLYAMGGVLAVTAVEGRDPVESGCTRRSSSRARSPPRSRSARCGARGAPAAASARTSRSTRRSPPPWTAAGRTS